MHPIATSPILRPGDSIPAFVLIDQHGETIGSYNQNIAGDPVLLYVAPDLFAASARDDLRALDRAAGDPGLAPTHVLALTRLPLEQVRDRAAAERLAVRVLGDPAGRMVDTLLYPADGAAPAARLYVLRQDSRIAAVLDGHGRVAEALAALDPLLPRGPHPVIERQAPVLLVDRIFPPEYCDFLIDLWNRGEKEADRVSGSAGSYQNVRTKKRTDHIVRDPAISREIQGHFIRRLLPEMAKAFQFSVSKAEYYRIGCYDAETGGYFRRHRDTGLPINAHRRYALSLNLNTGEYEGGDLIFPEFSQARYRPPRGGGVVFSCTLLHEALPVTRGRRFALFTFFSGEILARRGDAAA